MCVPNTKYTIFSIKKKISLNYPNSADMGFFQGTQERVRNSRGKGAISVRVTEVLLYCCYIDSAMKVSYENICINDMVGAPVAQWIKRWPTDLAVPSSSHARGEIYLTQNEVPLHTVFRYHPFIVLV